MIAERRPLDARAVALMVALCGMWGFQQVAMKAAAPFMAPVLQVALRSFLALLIILPIFIAKRPMRRALAVHWRGGVLVGALFAAQFFCVAQGLHYTSASHMVMFFYTAPIFSALGLHFAFPEEKIAPLQWGGIALAFLGVLLAFSGNGAGGERLAEAWKGDLLGLIAGALWGASTVTIRSTSLTTASASVSLFFHLLGASVLLFPVAVLRGDTHVTPASALFVSLAYQVLFMSVAGFFTWLALLKVYLASRLSILSFMTPVFGVAAAVLLLDEKIDIFFIAGSLLVIGGIVLVSARDVLTKMS